MSWKKIENITLLEAFDLVQKQKGTLIFRKEFKAGEGLQKPLIEFYVWEEAEE